MKLDFQQNLQYLIYRQRAVYWQLVSHLAPGTTSRKNYNWPQKAAPNKHPMSQAFAATCQLSSPPFPIVPFALEVNYAIEDQFAVTWQLNSELCALVIGNVANCAVCCVNLPKDKPARKTLIDSGYVWNKVHQGQLLHPSSSCAPCSNFNHLKTLDRHKKKLAFPAA